MAEPIQAQGIAGLQGALEQMKAYTEMLEREAAQKAQQQAEQAAEQTKEDQQHSVEFGAFVETAYLIAAADGTVSEAERRHLARGVSQLTQGRYSEDDINNMMQTAGSNLQNEGRQSRIDAIASVISDPELRRAAFLVGAGLAWLDRGIGEKEGLALQAISKEFGIPMNEMHQLLAKAKAAG